MKINKLAKSKTLNFNVLVPAVVVVLSSFGIVIQPEVVTAVIVLGNIVLRFFTDGSLSDK